MDELLDGSNPIMLRADGSIDDAVLVAQKAILAFDNELRGISK